jgi:filamentous hemagglutinin
MRQEVVIDIRGQVVSMEQRNGIIKAIVNKSGGAIGPDSITFKT